MASEGRGGFFGGFVIGATIGAAIAIALTREDARDLLVGKAKEATNFAKDKVADATSQWQANAADLYERGRQVIENARGNFGEADDEAQARAEKLRDEFSVPRFNPDE
jgi:gas vesicle protein